MMPRCYLALLFLATMLPASPFERVLAQELESNESGGGIEEIVVTARKREEFLEDTPLSVTAISSDTIDASGIARVDDIAAIVPNMIFESNPSGSTNLRIRGVGTSNRSLGFDPGVGMYIDGVFVPRALGALLDVVDVQQIEVLRGPQGTLFGKNTVGGAVNLITKPAHDEVEGLVRVRPGNFNSVDTRFTLNVPILEDRLFSRFSVAVRERDGYVDVARPSGDGENLAAFDPLSEVSSVAFLGSLRYLPTDYLTIDVVGNYSRSQTSGQGGQCFFVVEQPSAFLLPGYEEACRRSRPFSVEADNTQLNDLESYGMWATAEAELGSFGLFDEVTAKSITSWREQIPRFRFDLDGTALSGADFNASGGPGPEDGEPGFQQQIGQELQVSGLAFDDRLSVIAGVFAFWEEGSERLAVPALPDSIDRLSLTSIDMNNWTWALFGQATGDVTDWLSITAGLRYTQDKKGMNMFQENLQTGETENPNGRKVFEAWTPMASVALTAPDSMLDSLGLDHMMTYFTYSRGFKGGGFNAVSAGQQSVGEGDDFRFGPETLDNMEIGLKTIAFDERLTLNLAAFYGIYDDLQVTVIRVDGFDDDGAPLISRLTLNAAEATTQGVELEFLAQPWGGMLVNGSAGFVDASYDVFGGPSCTDGVQEEGEICPFNEITGADIDRSGQQLIGAPALQTFLAIQQALPFEYGPDWAQGAIIPRLEWSYQSKVRWLGQEVTDATQRGYNLLNARLSYALMDEQLVLALWGKNLTDEGYFTNVSPIISVFGAGVRYFAAPRTWGGEISYRF